MCPGLGGDDVVTELQPQLELNLTALRHSVRASWTDRRGPQTADVDVRALLGASAHVAITIDDPTVSRLHAELEARPDGVWLRDLGSRNGSWIDGVLVKQARIPAHGKFRIGTTTITLTASNEPSPIALWPEARFGALLARSEVMRELFVRLAQYAASDAPVLIQGETGTGKELAAQAIHDASERAEGPFVVVDCGALTEALLESELFGHARGAFTGAIAARAGAIEAAAGGSVFLDEIGELPLAMQPKLLRVLEQRTVRRVGETAHRGVDVRFISATHRDLQSMVGAGTFREDLYFRLAVLPAFVPPLRSRPGDIPLLLGNLLSRAPAIALDDATAQALGEYAWPGNVRELKAFAERAVALGPAQAWAMTRGLDVDASSPQRDAVTHRPAAIGDLPAVPTDVPFKVVRERWNDHLEREYMRSLIAKHGRGAISAIADDAGLDRSYVHRLLRKHDL